MKDIGFVPGMLFGVLMGGLFVWLVVMIGYMIPMDVDLKQKEQKIMRLQQQAIERGYMQHDPKTGKLDWVKPETKGEQP